MDFEKLDSELQEKIGACKSADEMLALAKEEGYELSDEELAGVSGGWGKKCEEYSHCGVPFWR